jgi:hypothetical protein
MMMVITLIVFIVNVVCFSNEQLNKGTLILTGSLD